MGKFKLFIHTIILTTTPSFLVYPQEAYWQIDANVQKVHSRVPKNFRKMDRYHLASYDDILKFLEEIESGTKDYREKDLRRINRFLTYLANEGILPNSDDAHELRNDIEDLLVDETLAFTELEEDDYLIIPAIGNVDVDIHLCKSKMSKKWKKTKKFIKKHKTAIIIGAVIVVATATVVIAVAASSSAGVAAAAGAAGAASSSKSDKKEKGKPSEIEASDSSLFEETKSIVDITDEVPTIKAAITEQVHDFKEFLLEDQIVQESNPSQKWNDASFGEKARELGAHLAHQALEEITELASVVPQLCEEIKDLSSNLLTENLSPQIDVLNEDPKENFENLVSNGHQVIDTLFNTDQAELFTSKSDELTNNFAFGEIPLPGGLSKIFSNSSKLIENGRTLDRAGFTKAGRSLMKHGYREGSVFPKPSGTPKQINEHGQKVLESIINHPERRIIYKQTKNLGKIVDIHAPGIGGVRYDASGELIGFLEP